MRDQQPSGFLLDGKNPAPETPCGQPVRTAKTQHAVGSGKACERMLYRTANNQRAQAQGAIRRIPSSQNGERRRLFQLGLREIFLNAILP